MQPKLISKSKVFNFSFSDDICIIDMNDPSKAVNSFTVSMLEDMDENIPKILAFSDLKGIIVTSSKKNCFAAGADISIFETLKTKEDGEKASLELHRIVGYFANAKVPTVAAIHGVCLGGGLELAIACQYRVCSNHRSTQLGLPEVQLGILPGGGGTQRLPRLIGIAAALDLILTGKKVDAKKALKIGIVDDCVPENQLLARAIAICKENFGKNSASYKNVQKTVDDFGHLFQRSIGHLQKGVIFNTFKHIGAGLSVVMLPLFGIRDLRRLF